METIILVESFICVCHRMIAGRTAQARSVAIVLAVEVYDKPSMAVIGEHSPRPSRMMLWSQLASTGRHRHKMPMNVVMKVAIVRPGRT